MTENSCQTFAKQSTLHSKFKGIKDQAEFLGIDYAYSLVSLNRKNGISLTPLDDDLKALIFALNDSAEALVLPLLKKLRMSR